MKRILSFILCMMLLVAILPVGALAEGAEPTGTGTAGLSEAAETELPAETPEEAPAAETPEPVEPVAPEVTAEPAMETPEITPAPETTPGLSSSDDARDSGNLSSDNGALVDGTTVKRSASVALLQEGAFPETTQTIEFATQKGSAGADAEATILAGLERVASAIDLSAFSIASDELLVSYECVVNNHPMLFYVGSALEWTEDAAGCVQQVFPRYRETGEALERTKSEVTDEINRVLASVDPSMTTLGKVLAVNDYFATRYEYDTSYHYYYANELFQYKTGVCQAYALAYKAIMDQLNVSCTTVTSTAMNHMWNLVNVDGSWYHIDVTWNDPVNDRIGRARHYYFMLSDAAIQSSRTTPHHDWTAAYTAANTKYDNYFWMDVEAPFGYLNGTWYCVSDAASGSGYGAILSCDLASGNTTVARSLGFRWNTPSGGWWIGCFSGMGVFDGMLIVNNETTFYGYKPSTGGWIAMGTPSLTAGDSIYGAYVAGANAIYCSSASPNESGAKGTMALVSSLVPVTSVAVSSASDTVTAGGTLQMSATVLPSNATNKAVAWSISSGVSYASINASGVLTANSAGSVTVRATAKDGSGVYGTKTIAVAAQTVPVNSVAVSSASDTVTAGGTLQMSATVLPSNATNKAVAWSISSGVSYASINASGVLTANSAGSVTVCATAQDGSGVYGTKTITVLAAIILTSSVTVSSPSDTVYVGETMQFIATVLPANATNKNVSWRIQSGPGSIDANGLFTASAAGAVIVVATSAADMNIYGAKTITVAARPAGTTYRAVIVGESNYAYNSSLPACTNDAYAMKVALDTSDIDYDSTVLIDATKSEIMSAISTKFGAATENDVSLFFFSGHGSSSTDSAGGALVAVDEYAIMPTELANALGAVSGRVYVVIDSCGSGSLIHANSAQGEGGEADFCSAIIEAFRAQEEVSALSGELRSGKFSVLTAAAHGETSKCTSTYSFFVDSLLRAGGFNEQTGAAVAMAGDINADKKLVFAEGYTFTYNELQSLQHSQVYPPNCQNVLFSRTGSAPVFEQMPTSVSVIGAANALFVGETTQLAATVLPENATNKGVTWSVSNDAVASISPSGLLTARAAGTVTVRATSQAKPSIYGEKTITAQPAIVLVASITVSSPGDTVYTGETLQMAATVLPNYATNRAVTWSISNGSENALISASGLLTALQPGAVTVRATANDGSGLYGEKTITITPIPVSGIVITGAAYVATGRTAAHGVTVTPQNASDKSVTWSVTAGDECLSIDAASGTVTGLAAGTGTIRATANDGSGVYGEMDVEVIDVSVIITGASTVAAGKSMSLAASVQPENLTGTTILWSLSEGDATYATLTGSNAAATIKAKPVTEAHTITVHAAAADGSAAEGIHAITIVPLVTNVYLKRGETYVTAQTVPVDLNDAALTELTITPELYPLDANQAVTWTISDTKRAFATYTENTDGSLTVSGFRAKNKPGTVTLTAKSADGSNKTAQVKLQFVKLAQTLSITAPKTELRGGESLALKANFDAGLTLTDKNVLWSLSEESLPYATITNAGKLATKPVYEETTITVNAQAKANEAATDSITLTLRPAVTRVDILTGGNVVTGQTIPLHTTGSAQLALTASVSPMDGVGAVEWTSSDRRGAFSALSVAPDGTATLTGRAAGTVTLTTKATDGSRKSATVKVQIGRIAQTLTITNDPAQNVVRAGAPLQLGYSIDAGATNKAVAWSLANAEDKAYATVSASGKVTAKAVFGSYDVEIVCKAKDAGGIEARYTVRVMPKIDGILTIRDSAGKNVTKGTVTLDMGGARTMQLTAHALGDTAAETVTWKSSTPATVSVVNGLVTIHKGGKATITATSVSNTKRMATVTVVATTLARTITVTPKTAGPITAGKPLTLVATAQPTGASKAVTWSIDPAYSAYASINAGGKLTTKNTLTRTAMIRVTATAKDGSNAAGYYDVTVNPASAGVVILLNGKAINNTVQTVDKNTVNTLQLSARVYPADATQAVSWTPTSVRGAANVEADGTVRLNKAGTVSITAKTSDGKTATFKLTIVARVQTIAVKSKTGAFTMTGGGKLTLLPDFGARVPTNQKVTWLLDPGDAPYATISKAGVLSAKKVTAQKTVTVRVISLDDPRVSATREITIRP